jgi:hypothetical protein
MRTVVPDLPSGRMSEAWRFCVGTGRFELALRRDYQESLALVQREIGVTLGRHEVTLVELTPVVDERPPWSDDRRLLGQEVL